MLKTSILKDKQTVLSQSKLTLKLAYPIILGQIAQMALGLIDMAMVGAVGYKELAAASLVTSVVNIPFIIGIGLTISISQLVSMANGRKEGKQISHILFNGFVLSGITAIIIALGLYFGRNLLFHLGQDEEVVVLAIPYLKLIAWSMIPMLLFMALKQFTDGLEFTKTAMLISLSSIPLNAFFNWVLIFGHFGMPRLELIGAGWGTLIARVIVFIALLLVVLRHKLFRKYIIIGKKQWYLSLKTWRELLYIGVPSSLQAGMEVGAFVVSAILIGTIGARELAAHQIAISIASTTFMVSIGLSQAGSIRVSNSFGRKDFSLLKNIGETTLLLSFIYGIICVIFFFTCRNYIPQLFTTDLKVAEISISLLILAGIMQVSDTLQAISSGLLRGIKDVRIPTIYIAIAYWVFGIPAGSILAFRYDFGAKGIWIGFIVGLTIAAILLTNRFLKRSRKMKEEEAETK